jgi:ABC-type multidrug transport system fused ATPase/permease subunit
MALRLLANTLLALGIVALLFREDWRAGLVGGGYAVCAILAWGQRARPLTRAWGEVRQTSADLSGFFGERLSGTEDIRANGGEAYVMRPLVHPDAPRVAELDQGYGDAGVSFDAVWLVTLAAKIAVLAVGAWLFTNGRATHGDGLYHLWLRGADGKSVERDSPSD